MKLNVTLKLGEKTLDLSNLIPGTEGGSMTDYSGGEPEVIHWLPIDDTVVIGVAKEHQNVAIGPIRATDILSVKTLATLKSGQRYEMPLKTQSGEGILIFEL